MKSKRTYMTSAVGVSPPSSSQHVSRSMKGNKASGTKPELILARLLRKRIALSSLPGSPDFVYPRVKVAIFVQGCFWHRCPIHGQTIPKTNPDFWKRKFERNVERDTLNRLELESEGWRVIEIWEHEIRDDPRHAAERVKAELRRL